MPTKNGITWINFSKIRKARCTLTPLSLRSARLTKNIWFKKFAAVKTKRRANFLHPNFFSFHFEKTSDTRKR